MHGRERNVVVEAFVVGAVRALLVLLLRRLALLLVLLALRLLALLLALLLRLSLLLLLLLLLASTLTIRPAAEQLHGAVDVDDDFGGVAFDAVLFPLTGLQLAFDVALRAFAQVLSGDLGNLAEQRYTVPLGTLNLLARLLVGPLLAGGQARGDLLERRMPITEQQLLQILPNARPARVFLCLEKTKCVHRNAA